MEVIIAKAQPITSDQPTPEVHIHITADLPNSGGYEDLPAWSRYLDSQAEQLERALINSLPGGTYDRLLSRMHARKASHFRIAHGLEV